MIMKEYLKIKKILLAEQDNVSLVQSVSEHVYDLLGNDCYPLTNVEKITNIPESAKDIFYGWAFQAEIGGSLSLFDYLVNMARAKDISIVLNTLENLKAKELYQRLRDGVFLSKNEEADFWNDDYLYELENIDEAKDFTSFETIDSNIEYLAGESFTSRMAQHIRDNSTFL